MPGEMLSWAAAPVAAPLADGVADLRMRWRPKLQAFYYHLAQTQLQRRVPARICDAMSVELTMLTLLALQAEPFLPQLPHTFLGKAS
jgi:hypothetical protein